MTDLHTAARKLALEALEGWAGHGMWVWPESALDQAKRNTEEAITALRSALANEALDKMAENARELGLDYEPAQQTIHCKHRRENNGVCPHHNLHCGWPKCNEPEQPAQHEPKLPEFFARLEYDTPGWDVVVSVYQRREDATLVLVHREPLPNQQPAQQDIYGWKVDGYIDLFFGPNAENEAKEAARQIFSVAFPLYTRPQAREPLTDEQIMAIGRELGLKCRLGGNPNIDFDYARAIEAAHGITGEKK